MKMNVSSQVDVSSDKLTLNVFFILKASYKTRIESRNRYCVSKPETGRKEECVVSSHLILVTWSHHCKKDDLSKHAVFVLALLLKVDYHLGSLPEI